MTEYKDAPRIIAFAGPEGSGKSTAAKMLWGLGFTQLSFADPIRQMLLALGVDEDLLRTRKREPIPWLGGKTSRQLMRSLGTEWGRGMVSDSIWIDVVIRRVRHIVDNGAGAVVFDDCRFDNEAEAIHALGGIVVRVTRPGHEPSVEHASERGLSADLLDHVIHNTGDVAGLETCVRAVAFTGAGRLKSV